MSHELVIAAAVLALAVLASLIDLTTLSSRKYDDSFALTYFLGTVYFWAGGLAFLLAPFTYKGIGVMAAVIGGLFWLVNVLGDIFSGKRRDYVDRWGGHPNSPAGDYLAGVFPWSKR